MRRSWSNTASASRNSATTRYGCGTTCCSGVEPNFPIIDSLTALTGIAARTSRLKIGTGILVLPLRNPVTLAKQLASIDLLSEGRLIMGMASGWYKREFDAAGIPFDKRGKTHGRES